MHGLIFVTWEKYITERFGHSLLYTYRSHMRETIDKAPLASRVYDDATLIAGVETMSRLSGLAMDVLLREYGRYFIINGLTRHLCSYLLAQAHSGRELLLLMQSGHAQLRRTPDGITPPLFRYEKSTASANRVTLIYDSPRKLCSVVIGAIEGAAERYHEEVSIREHSCMHHGAPHCRISAQFQPMTHAQQAAMETPEQVRLRQEKHQLANVILTQLPMQEGITLAEVQGRLQSMGIITPSQLRPHALFEAIRHLQYAGLVASTANQGDDLARRRYWRAPTTETV